MALVVYGGPDAVVARGDDVGGWDDSRVVAVEAVGRVATEVAELAVPAGCAGAQLAVALFGRRVAVAVDTFADGAPNAECPVLHVGVGKCGSGTPRSACRDGRNHPGSAAGPDGAVHSVVLPLLAEGAELVAVCSRDGRAVAVPAGPIAVPGLPHVSPETASVGANKTSFAPQTAAWVNSGAALHCKRSGQHGLVAPLFGCPLAVDGGVKFAGRGAAWARSLRRHATCRAKAGTRNDVVEHRSVRGVQCRVDEDLVKAVPPMGGKKLRVFVLCSNQCAEKRS